MTIDLYYSVVSAPCRAVRLVANTLGVELNLKTMDLGKGEHMTPEYLKLNPQHTIPTLVDDGFTLWESRAIMVYLVNKYGKDSTLYPEEPQARALVDQRLYFDIGTLYQRFADYTFPQLFTKAPADDTKLQKVEEALDFLDTFLEKSPFVAGDHLTLADLSIVVSVSNFEAMKIDAFKYPRIKAYKIATVCLPNCGEIAILSSGILAAISWFETVKNATPGYEEVNGVGKEAFKEMVNSMTKSIEPVRRNSSLSLNRKLM